MKKFKVKEIYFVTTGDKNTEFLPVFKMQDGTIINPYMTSYGGGWRVEWLDQKELAVRDGIKSLWELEKKKKKSWWGW